MNLLFTVCCEPSLKFNRAGLLVYGVAGEYFQPLPEGVACLLVHLLLAHPALLLRMGGANKVPGVAQAVGGVS